MKFRNLLLIFTFSFLILNSGCTPTLPVNIDEDIDYEQEINLT